MTSTESLPSASDLDKRRSGMRMLSNRFLDDLDAIADRFANAEPFKHVLIPEFFAPDVLQEILQQFPCPNEEKMRNEFGQPSRKYVCRDVRNIGGIYRAIDDFIQTAEWCQLMGRITGIDGLLYDPDYFGAGTHDNLSGQGMDVHVDFNRHQTTGYHRRINAIIYLNEWWQPEWGGALRLHKDPWDFKHDSYVEYPPLLNHCVIFETNEKSWHGFERVSAPAGISRKSFTIYMYTKDRPAHEVAPKHATIYVQKGPPAFITPGHTLTQNDVAEVEGIFQHRNGYLQGMYREHSRLLVQNESLLKNIPVPMLGYARQKSIRGNLYDDNLGLGSFVELTCEARKPLKKIVLRGRVPPFLEKNTIFLKIAGYPDQTCPADGAFELTAPVSIASGETVVLTFGGETAVQPPNADVRTYSMFLTGLEFVPA
jgi:2-oxoglutarate-Fe(II)-dependent oxygenase superfamily protein